MVFLKDVSCKKIKSCKKDKDWDKRFKFSLVTTQTKNRDQILEKFSNILYKKNWGHYITRLLSNVLL